jgi:hypothetical protein
MIEKGWSFWIGLFVADMHAKLLAWYYWSLIRTVNEIQHWL